jgi:glycosyltransferase involved in cell wall biosynthesis
LAGKKNYTELQALYRQHDFVLQAPLKEGFGKVPVEGFFHGLIPIISNTSMAGHITANGERGFLFNASNEGDLAKTLLSIREKKEVLPVMVEKGRAFAKSQTLEAWAEEYYKTVTNYFA